jgi:hypothetical protein
MEKLTPEMLGGLFALWQDGKRTLAEVHAEVAMHASAWAADCKARDYYVAEMRLAEDRAEKAGARIEALERGRDADWRKFVHLRDDNERIRVLGKELAQKESRIEALERERAELRGMGHADLQTLGDGRDYALAAYMLIDSKVTKEASLRELCVAASKDGCISRNDWEGIREYWWRAALAAREKRA